ncbi:zinc ribbon domain-containing protein [Methanobacterium sp. ACI-7]|uniref:zinc ribbon domain-containing protein n=1 Tax=unclassified Methanobacterium TaxID=2627676 RepID=UPI0039C31E35
MVFCHNCGTENEDDTVLCSKCHKKLYYTKTNWEVKFVILVVFLAIGVILVSSFLLIQDSMYIPTINSANIPAYKFSCIEIDLNKSESDLEQLNGKKVKIKGELSEIMQNINGNTDVQVKVPGLSKYPYAVASYSSEIPFAVGDKLEVYGEFSNFVIVDNNDVPFIKAAYIEKI